MKLLKDSLKQTIRNHKKRARRHENWFHYFLLSLIVVFAIGLICVININALTLEETREILYDIDPSLIYTSDWCINDFYNNRTPQEVLNIITSYINEHYLHTHKLLCTKKFNYEFDTVLNKNNYYILLDKSGNIKKKIRQTSRNNILFKYFYMDILCYVNTVPLKRAIQDKTLKIMHEPLRSPMPV